MQTIRKLIFIAFAMLLAANTAAFAQEQSTEDLYRQQLVDTILGGETFKDNVSRGKFTEVMCRALRLETGEAVSTYFADVSEETDYGGAICYAVKSGHVSEGEYFYPSDNITYQDAVKIAVSFLGYSSFAEYSGGYPLGYLNVASQLELTKEVKNEGELSVSGAYNLVFNMLHTTPMEIVPVKNGIGYSQEGPNVLEKLYGVSMTKGIVTGTAYNSLTDDDVSGKQSVFIDGEAYYCENTSPEMIGQRYRVYFDDDENIVFMYPEKNTSVEFEIRDDFKIDGTDAVYSDPDTSRDKTYRLDKSFYLIYNGKKADVSEVNFDKLLGRVILSDNSGDGRYDTVYIEEYDFITVSRYSKSEKLISDDKGKELSLSGDVRYILYAEDGTPAALSSLKSGEVLRVAESLDKKLVLLHILSESKSLYVSSADTENHILTSGDERYWLSKHFTEKYTVKAGDKKEFALYKDIIAAVKSYDEKWQYGYMMRYYTEPSDDNRVGIKLLNQSSEIINSLFNKTITIDGVRYKNFKEEDVRRLFFESGSFKPQLIRFRQNGEGQLVGIDTAVLNSAAKIDKKENDGNSLTEFKFNESSFLYKSEYKNCSPYFNLGKATIFVVPKDASQTENYSARTSDYFYNDRRISLSVYDLDENMSAAAAVFYEDFSNRDLGSGNTYLITDISTAADDDDNIGYQLELWSNNQYYYYFISEDKVVKKYGNGYTEQNPSVLCRGDLVRLDAESNGKITSLTVDFDANPKIFDRNGGSAPFNGTNGTPMYQSGKVYTYNGSFITLTNTYTNAGYDFSLKNLRQFSASTTNIVRFNVKNGIAEQALQSDIKTYLANGENADFVVLRQNNYRPLTIVIYEGLEEIK